MKEGSVALLVVEYPEKIGEFFRARVFDRNRIRFARSGACLIGRNVRAEPRLEFS